MGSKGYWVGAEVIFSGKDAAYFYKVIKTENLDSNLLKFDEHSLSLSRIELSDWIILVTQLDHLMNF